MDFGLTGKIGKKSPKNRKNRPKMGFELKRSNSVTATDNYFARSPENFCGFSFRVCLGILHWKKAGIFWWIFSGVRFPRNEARKLLKKFGENSERNSGQNPGQKFKKFAATFSDLTDNCIRVAQEPETGTVRTVFPVKPRGIWSVCLLRCCFAPPSGPNRQGHFSQGLANSSRFSLSSLILLEALVSFIRFQSIFVKSSQFTLGGTKMITFKFLTD